MANKPVFMVEENWTIQSLIGLWKFFKWLDNARWYSDRERKYFTKKLLDHTNRVWRNCGFETLNCFKVEHLVLSHWLTYIFDYQMPSGKVWETCFPIMARIVLEFQKGFPIEEIFKKYVNDNDNEDIYFYLCKKQKK